MTTHPQKPKKTVPISLYDLQRKICERWTFGGGYDERTTATHRYTLDDVLEVLRRGTRARITRYWTGVAFRAMNVRPWQDGKDRQRYYYLTPHDARGQESFINPFRKNQNDSTIDD